MPYTARQRRYFHAQAAKGKPGMKKLAEEADSSARAGKEKKPVEKTQKTQKAPKTAASYPAQKTVAKKTVKAAPGLAKKAGQLRDNPGQAAKKIAKTRSTDKSVIPGTVAKKVAQAKKAVRTARKKA